MEGQIPFGRLPEGITIQHPPAQLPPDLMAALRRARDESGGRYAVAVFTTDQAFDRVSLFFGRGPEWNDSKAFLTAYQLFVAEFLRINPGLLQAVSRRETSAVPSDEFGPLAPPASPEVAPQGTFGPSASPELPL